MGPLGVRLLLTLELTTVPTLEPEPMANTMHEEPLVPFLISLELHEPPMGPPSPSGDQAGTLEQDPEEPTMPGNSLLAHLRPASHSRLITF